MFYTAVLITPLKLELKVLFSGPSQKSLQGGYLYFLTETISCYRVSFSRLPLYVRQKF